MSQLVFYTNPQSRGVTVQWMLNECDAVCDISYTTNTIEYEDINSSNYLAINPMGKLPVLVVKQDDNVENSFPNDTVITESVAICTYLADAYPNANLAPAIISPERGAYYRWLFWACNVLEPAMMVEFGLLAREQSAEINKALGFKSFSQALTVLESELTDKNYLCNDKFTTADLYVSSMLQWAKLKGAIDEMPLAVARYMNTISNREACPKPS